MNFAKPSFVSVFSPNKMLAAADTVSTNDNTENSYSEGWKISNLFRDSTNYWSDLNKRSFLASSQKHMTQFHCCVYVLFSVRTVLSFSVKIVV